jgi:hypothetical protein
VEVRDVVVGHDVPGSVDLHRHVGGHDGGMDLAELQAVLEQVAAQAEGRR